MRVLILLLVKCEFYFNYRVINEIFWEGNNPRFIHIQLNQPNLFINLCFAQYLAFSDIRKLWNIFPEYKVKSAHHKRPFPELRFSQGNQLIPPYSVAYALEGRKENILTGLLVFRHPFEPMDEKVCVCFSISTLVRVHKRKIYSMWNVLKKTKKRVTKKNKKEQFLFDYYQYVCLDNSVNYVRIRDLFFVTLACFLVLHWAYSDILIGLTNAADFVNIRQIKVGLQTAIYSAGLLLTIPFIGLIRLQLWDCKFFASLT